MIAGLTSFVGRGELLQSLVHQLQRGTRMLTLAGPAGVGKTRLAAELVRRMQKDYDAFAVVHLADLNLDVDSPLEVAAHSLINMIVDALDIIDHQSKQPLLEVLVERLRRTRVLLVLDNCEHLLDPVSEVVLALLQLVPQPPDQAQPQLSMVATSRHYLGLPGENVVHVPELATPPADATREQARNSDAVRLLLDRAKEAGHPITDGHDWHAIVRLVQASGGLPLALELIAALLGGGLAPTMILQRLDGGRLLASPLRRGIQRHHETLTTALDISWELCGPTETEADMQRRLWARLAVFSGGFDLEAAEQVCGGDDRFPTTEVMDTLSALVRQSIVISTPKGRYYQLQPLREYGLRKLSAHGEEETVRARHCAWVQNLTRTAAQSWFGPKEPAWLARLHGEMANIRTAITWTLAQPGRVEVGLQIATDVLATRMPFFYALHTQVCGWLDDLLAVHPAPSSGIRVGALAMLAWTRLVLGDQDRGEARRKECRELAHQLDATDGPPVLMLEGTRHILSLADTNGLDMLARARDAFRAAGDLGSGHMAALILALGAGLLGPSDVADMSSEECLADAEAHGAEWAITWARWTLSLPARTQPRDVLQQVLPIQIALGDRWGTTWCVEAQAWRWAASGEAEAAARLLGGAISLQRRHGVAVAGLLPFMQQRDEARTRIVAMIGEPAYRRAYQDGTTKSIDQIYDLALRPLHAASSTTEGSPADLLGSLPDQQRSVAKLVGKGHTNREIADELRVSPRTVETHLGKLFSRLGFSNRTQLATWVGEQTGDQTTASRDEN